ncbi:elongation of very long chain fatty acids protein 2 [Trichonephila clavata]|uniref:Elongation of very long chain fatty acids protein n=1 Tax=Trichonephila clavata TaxID=2740835 RepID=A0A8X6FUA7_TRICU|nr:elongation of very long chain fatty acids protein 2 [Trichonephila clavata]
MPFWHYYLLKYLDLLDTVFFVLRKKYNQITFLHVIHHAGLCLILNSVLPHVYKAVAYYPLLGFTINSGIHVIMYTYYGLAAFGPSMKKYLWWKKYLTIVQIAQMFVIIVYMMVGFLTACEEFGSIEKMAFSFAALNFVMFVNFYKKYKKD